MTLSPRKKWRGLRQRYAENHTQRANRTLHLLGIPLTSIGLPLIFTGVGTPVGLTLFRVGGKLQSWGHRWEPHKEDAPTGPINLVLAPNWWWRTVRGKTEKAR